MKYLDFSVAGYILLRERIVEICGVREGEVTDRRIKISGLFYNTVNTGSGSIYQTTLREPQPGAGNIKIPMLDLLLSLASEAL